MTSSAYYNLTNTNLQNVLKEHKPFLKSVHTTLSRNIPRLLAHASNKELEILIYIIHLESKGKMPITRSDFARIRKSKQLNKISHLKYNEEYLKLIQPSNREKLIDFLTGIKSILPILVNPLFTKQP